MSLFATLPNELILVIIDNLSWAEFRTLVQVNKRSRMLLSNEIFWRKFALTILQERLVCEVFRCFGRHSSDMMRNVLFALLDKAGIRLFHAEPNPSGTITTLRPRTAAIQKRNLYETLVKLASLQTEFVSLGDEDVDEDGFTRVERFEEDVLVCVIFAASGEDDTLGWQLAPECPPLPRIQNDLFETPMQQFLAQYQTEHSYDRFRECTTQDGHPLDAPHHFRRIPLFWAARQVTAELLIPFVQRDRVFADMEEFGADVESLGLAIDSMRHIWCFFRSMFEITNSIFRAEAPLSNTANLKIFALGA